MKNRYFSAATMRHLGLTALLAGGTALAANAQLGYPLANVLITRNTYNDLGSNGSVISTGGNYDDANSGATDIGFTFSYGGQTFTQFVLNTNGFIRLGSNAPATPYFNPYAQTPVGGAFSSTANTNLIAPFNTDLEAGSSPTEYRVSTTGTAPNRICTIQWKNVSDKTRTASATVATALPKQLANFSFQVRLFESTNGIEFVYDQATKSANATNATFAVVGLKGSGAASNQFITFVKPSNNPWAYPIPQEGNYLGTTAAPNGFNVRNEALSSLPIDPTTPLPDAGRTYRFDPATNANDAFVPRVYGIDRLPARQGFAYRAVVRNSGNNATTATNLTLNISGANTASVSAPVASLAAGAQAIVTLPSVTLANAGTNTVQLALASDGNNGNNSQTVTTVTEASSPTAEATFSYIKTNLPYTSAYGFNPADAGEDQAFCAAYTATTAFRVSAVRVMIGGNATNDNQSVFGVVAALDGTILGQSADYPLSAGDVGTYVTFTMPTPISVPAGAFLVGLGVHITSTQFFPMAVQPEAPQRPGSFYQIDVATPPTAPYDIATAPTPINVVYMVEAVGFGTAATAAASPALTRAFSLYPNPSTDGQFNLAVRGANAPAGLSVEVTNQLGQRVYNGSARDNFTNTLDLRNLANGIYFLTLRNGSEYSTSKVSINR